MCRRSLRRCRAVEGAAILERCVEEIERVIRSKGAAVKEDLEVTIPDRKRLVDEFPPQEYGNFGDQELSSETVRELL
jgi:hypothetical protein